MLVVIIILIASYCISALVCILSAIIFSWGYNDLYWHAGERKHLFGRYCNAIERKFERKDCHTPCWVLSESMGRPGVNIVYALLALLLLLFFPFWAAYQRLGK